MSFSASIRWWLIFFLLVGNCSIPLAQEEPSEFGRLQPLFLAINQRDVEAAEKALDELEDPLENKELDLMLEALHWLDARGQWLPFLQTLCEKNPDSGMLKYYHARAQWRAGNVETCMELCREAIQNEPEAKLLLYRVAALAYTTENNVEASQWLDQLLELEPDHLEGRYLRACLFVREGERNKAKEILQDVIKEDPKHYLAHFELGKIYNHEGKSEEAEKHLSLTVKGHPFFLEAYNALLVALSRQEKQDSLNAIQKIAKHLKSWSHSKMERLRYSFRNPTAIPPRDVFELAMELMEVGRHDLAKSYLEKLEELDKSNDPCRLLLADLRFQQREYQEALDIIQKIQEARIKALDTYAALKAWSLFRLGREKDCHDYLDSIPDSLKLHPRIQELIKQLDSK